MIDLLHGEYLLVDLLGVGVPFFLPRDEIHHFLQSLLHRTVVVSRIAVLVYKIDDAPVLQVTDNFRHAHGEFQGILSVLGLFLARVDLGLSFLAFLEDGGKVFCQFGSLLGVDVFLVVSPP